MLENKMCVADVPLLNSDTLLCRKNPLNNALPVLKVYPNYLVQYYEKNHLKFHARLSDYFENFKSKKLENLIDNSCEGLMSVKSSKALRVAISWLNFESKNQKVFCSELNRDVNFKLNFITLTLPVPQIKCIVLSDDTVIDGNLSANYWKYVNEGSAYAIFNYSDDFCKHDLLNHFLTIMRRDFKVHNYVWRAETQKNGNIHFHITLNKFIYLSDIRAAWNKVLGKTDMIKKYSKKFSGMTFLQYKSYRYSIGNPNMKDVRKAYDYGVKTAWSDPNSTDVHAIHKIKNIAAYLCEYLTKNNADFRRLSGFLWRSSMLLSKLKSGVQYISSAVDNELRYLMKRLPNKIIKSDYATIFAVGIKDIRNIFKDSKILEIFVKYRQKVFDDYKKQFQLVI